MEPFVIPLQRYIKWRLKQNSMPYDFTFAVKEVLPSSCYFISSFRILTVNLFLFHFVSFSMFSSFNCFPILFWTQSVINEDGDDLMEIFYNRVELSAWHSLQETGGDKISIQLMYLSCTIKRWFISIWTDGGAQVALVWHSWQALQVACRAYVLSCTPMALAGWQFSLRKKLTHENNPSTLWLRRMLVESLSDLVLWWGFWMVVIPRIPDRLWNKKGKCP